MINYFWIEIYEIKINKLESNYVDEIESYICEYELINNVNIKDVAIIYDVNKNEYFDETERKFVDFYNACACSWSAIGTINYYTNRNLSLLETEDANMFINLEKDYEIINDVLYIKVHAF
jgi:hypothetical protein